MLSPVIDNMGSDNLCFTFWYSAFGIGDSTQLHVFKTDPSSSTRQMVSPSLRCQEKVSLSPWGKENGEFLKSRLTPWFETLLCFRWCKGDCEIKSSLVWVRERTTPTNRHLSAKLVPTFADRVCHVAIVRNPYCRILGFLDQSRYFFFHVAPQSNLGWTPFQIHYFPENLVTPGIEPRPLGP
jgi:hypothetical protein